MYRKYKQDHKQPSTIESNNFALKRRMVNKDDGECDKLKLKYGAYVAKLLENNVQANSFSANHPTVWEMLSSLRKDILKLRPGADQYLPYAFYLGLKFAGSSTDQTNELQPQYTIKFLGGTKEIKTSIIRSPDALNNYCANLYENLSYKELIDSLNDELESDLEKIDQQFSLDAQKEATMNDSGQTQQ